MNRDVHACARTPEQVDTPILIYSTYLGASGGVMVCKLDQQAYKRDFESHWVPYSYMAVCHI